MVQTFRLVAVVVRMVISIISIISAETGREGAETLASEVVWFAFFQY